LAKAMDALDDNKYGSLVKKEKAKVLAIFEDMFDHQSFTGRSGTFYGYEGLGSIYWHMVSKLLLATEECFFRAGDEGADPRLTGALKDHYYEIKAGIGLYKSPKLYGAFPTDAYSHTPGHAGAKQPGMTGQVKEDFISRMGELGMRINQGEIVFDTRLINHEEFAEKELHFECFNLEGKKQQIALKKQQLGFTLCQVPIVYTRNDIEEIVITFKNGKKEKLKSNRIDKQTSSMIFKRTAEVRMLEVSVNK